MGSGGAWPADGELDILEPVGSNPGRVFGTVHTALSGGPCTALRNDQMTWTDEMIAFAVGGQACDRYANPRTWRVAWPFDRPQYLLLNIAIDGVLGGAVDDRSVPVTMEVDDVRTYQVPR